MTCLGPISCSCSPLSWLFCLHQYKVRKSYSGTCRINETLAKVPCLFLLKVRVVSISLPAHARERETQRGDPTARGFFYMCVSGTLHRLVSPLFFPDAGSGLPMMPTIG